MATMQALKRRIKSAKNIKQITKAMEMVAASKMRKAQAQALASRPYSRKLENVLATISEYTDASEHPLLVENNSDRTLYVLFSTDKSLAGSLNANLFRGALDDLAIADLSKSDFVIVGEKARQLVVSSGLNLVAEFNKIPDPINFQAALPIAHYISSIYLEGKYHSVKLLYMDFVSTLVQKFRSIILLPFSASLASVFETPGAVFESTTTAQYQFEPSASEILDWLLPYYIELVIFQTLLESRASEHSARMVAMKNASDNATEIIADMTLSYNKQRQAKITNEILDNTTASMAVSK